MVKGICNLPLWQRANIWNLQRTKTNLQESDKQPHQKVGKRYEQTLLKIRHFYSQQTYEKNVYHHWSLEKCKWKPYWDTISHQLEWRSLKKSGDSRCWRGCGETGTLLHCWWECKLVQSLWKTDPQGSRNRNTIWTIYPKDYKSFYYKDTCTHMFIAALFTITKTWNQPECSSMIDLIKKMWHIYTIEHYAAIKNDEFMSFAGTWMKLETIILSKLTQEQKTKHRMFSLISGCWTMRTHGHIEGNITHWGLLGAQGLGEG